jgi:hypothetical protein
MTRYQAQISASGQRGPGPFRAESLCARVDYTTEETGRMLASCSNCGMIVTVRNILMARAAAPWQTCWKLHGLA